MNAYRTVQQWAAALTLLILLAAGSAAQAQAQQRVSVLPGTETSEVWDTFIGPQLSELLQSPIAEVRRKALGHIITMTHAFGDELDLRGAVPALVTVYREDADEQCRLAAVVGLHALGDEGGMQQVRQGVASEPSKRVQHTALALLMDHYGPETFEGDESMARVAASVQAHFEDSRNASSYLAKHKQ